MFIVSYFVIMTEDRLILMKRTSPLSLVLISVLCSFTLGSSDFHLINLSKSYEEAKTYCREMFADLATINNRADMSNLITLVSSATARAWIGLEIGDVWLWHWSLSDQNLDFFNWKSGEPQVTNEEACAAMDQHGEWFESDCSTRRNFVCHGSSDATGYLFVAETKSWRDAQSHCRGLLSDLVSIQSAQENMALRNVAASQTVWIGLFKDPWKWSDGSNSSFRFWKPSQPNYAQGQDCTAAIFRDGGKWNDLNCNSKRNFVCSGAIKPIPATTTQQTTQETITTDQMSTNPTSPTTSGSPPGVVVTFHFTVATTTEQSNTTNVSSTAAPTTGVQTTPNTTGSESLTSSAELNNTTTEMSTVTAARPPLMTNVNTTTESVSASVTGTLAQSTTQSSTLMSTSQSLHAETLILIQENKTWIEAMSYCREHHIDLVHITGKDIQDEVAHKAKNATSPHVWMGLHYTCSFKYWFWTKFTSSCYQNWLDGHGPEREYDCGVSGAVEATGRQQWVGLPETEKLNFICSACAV
ncbi:uncharacterized protein LOC125016945 [Mugil cephalus]|uniref:uncharacterized protein LOC125016945 n=1 Tax=Mugil cephalus TaxID=48193 RepID=UPI001FB85592|nr:uncharacterized protein LOC125016945 [Mugil cephalus]